MLRLCVRKPRQYQVSSNFTGGEIQAYRGAMTCPHGRWRGRGIWLNKMMVSVLQNFSFQNSRSRKKELKFRGIFWSALSHTLLGLKPGLILLWINGHPLPYTGNHLSVGRAIGHSKRNCGQQSRFRTSLTQFYEWISQTKWHFLRFYLVPKWKLLGFRVT